MSADTNDLFSQTKEKLKSYWNRPGGKLGTILLWCVVGFGAFKIYDKILPKLIEMFDNTAELAFGITYAAVAMAVAAFVVGGLFFAVASPKFRLGIVLVWEKIFINSWLQFFIKTDPKRIARAKIDEFKEQREEFKEKSLSIATELENAKGELAKNQNKENDLQMQLQSAAKHQAAPEQIASIGREIGWVQKINKQLLPIVNGLNNAVDKCDKIYKNSEWALRDMQNDFDYTCKLYDITTKGGAALRSASKMFGGGTGKELGDEAMLYMQTQISYNISSMKQEMSNIDGFVSSIDLQNGQYEEQGLKVLQDVNPDAYKKYISYDEAKNAIPVQGQTINFTPQPQLTSSNNDLTKW